MVLVGGDGGELGLREDKAAELLLVEVVDGGGVPLPPLDQVHARLELVHRVQDNLKQTEINKHVENSKYRRKDYISCKNSLGFFVFNTKDKNEIRIRAYSPIEINCQW